MRKLLVRVDALVDRLVKNYTLWIFAGLFLLGVVAVTAWHAVFPRMPEAAVYGSMQVADQGWELNQREKFYQTSQGNLVVPFSWFMSLERQPQGFPPRLGEVDLFSSPKVQARYGLLPDTSQYNPYQLPVGIVKDVLADRNVALLGQGHRVWIGISCAACHTGQLVHQGRAVRIDGGQATWNFAQWSGDLVSNLFLTATLPGRFDRFAKRVLSIEGLQDNPTSRRALRNSMERYFNSPLIKDAIDALFNHTYPVAEGNARTAALGRGVNGEFGLLDSRNIIRNHGPVSYPPLWYTHDYDWVQSVAAIRQPMGRNLTEAWGVSVRVELNSPKYRFASTARLHDMFWMETLISVLRAPVWPPEVLGPVDPKKVERGRYLYEQAKWSQALSPADEQLPGDPKALIAPPNPYRKQTGYCARCHAPALETTKDSYGNGYIQLPLYRLGVLGTDPHDAVEFNARKPYTGVLADAFSGSRQVGIGDALATTISGIEKRWYDEEKVPPRCRQIMNGFRDNLFRAPLGYPARPLAGYWATGPYLHNGSVRTLYQLLSPVEERDETFYLGSYEFDPREVGYRNLRIDGAFLYDTRIAGNHNSGHEFRDALQGTKGVIGPFLPPEDRRAIVEYMKVMNDVADSRIITPEALAQRRRLLDLMRDAYEAKAGVEGYEAADKPLVELCQKLENIMDQLSSGERKTQSYIASPAPAGVPVPAPAEH